MQMIQEAGGHVQEMDVTNNQQMQDMLTRIMVDQGRIDALVNNAGYPVYGAVEDVTMQEAHKQFEVNLFGLARLTQMVMPHMRKQGTGRIINVSSMGGKMYTPLGAWYHASKYALEGWSDCLRLETAQHGIAVVIIEPGFIHTEFANRLVKPMLEASGRGAYAQMARAMANATLKAYKRQNSSPPSKVATVIALAIRTRKPHTRYVVGKMGRSMLTLRKLLTDRAFDKALLTKLSYNTKHHPY